MRGWVDESVGSFKDFFQQSSETWSLAKEALKTVILETQHSVIKVQTEHSALIGSNPTKLFTVYGSFVQVP